MLNSQHRAMRKRRRAQAASRRLSAQSVAEFAEDWGSAIVLVLLMWFCIIGLPRIAHAIRLQLCVIEAPR
jgi:hypothetical protein